MRLVLQKCHIAVSLQTLLWLTFNYSAGIAEDLFLHKSIVKGLSFDYSLFSKATIGGANKKYYAFEYEGKKKNIYPCLIPGCNYIFSNPDTRKEHRKGHFLQAEILESKGEIIRCDYCKQNFNSTDSYRRHILRKHSSIKF